MRQRGQEDARIKVQKFEVLVGQSSYDQVEVADRAEPHALRETNGTAKCSAGVSFVAPNSISAVSGTDISS